MKLRHKRNLDKFEEDENEEYLTDKDRKIVRQKSVNFNYNTKINYVKFIKFINFLESRKS